MRLNSLLCAGLGVLLATQACRSPESDDKLQSTIEAALADNQGIEVDVEEGNVTLDGQIGSDSLKQLIEDKVKQAGGTDIKSIHNNIMVNLPEPEDAREKYHEIVEGAVDSTLTRDVNRVLEEFPTITAQVKDGVIIATGNIEKAKLDTLRKKLEHIKPKSIDMKGVTSR
ncbi:BON domain-containing protein [Sphingobacterium thalpophilum]|uniref:BON domain n=1 Tax=Sphingobacterium thalpophilum TaxID=259 RepID=A0A4U9VWC1_9SPHI|nr:MULTISPECIES: BON domain-containing protein [Sphingobacterium]MCW8311974.1 BON domain-containing protein [Sphingobacterium sp. InxBP1]VTR51846.1 BON domain [Sphingobacterium thalpophilum]